MHIRSRVCPQTVIGLSRTREYEICCLAKGGLILCNKTVSMNEALDVNTMPQLISIQISKDGSCLTTRPCWLENDQLKQMIHVQHK